MRIQLVSDLHLDWFEDKGESLISSMHRNPIVDILVIAGDIYSHGRDEPSMLRPILRNICDEYATSEVIYICGNHEPYRVGIEKTISRLRDIDDEIENLHFLENDIVEFGGISFAGCTLWFKRHQAPPNVTRQVADFNRIPDILSVYDRNEESRHFLNSVVGEKTIVITHHAPSYQSVSSKYVSSELNPFFVCPLNYMIAEHKPMYWLHGHMHEYHEYDCVKTRVMCYPHGYLKYEKSALASKLYCGRIFEIPNKSMVQEQCN